MQATPAAPANISHDVIEALTKRTQDGGTEVVNAKAGKVRGPCAMGEAMGKVLTQKGRHTVMRQGLCYCAVAVA